MGVPVSSAGATGERACTYKPVLLHIVAPLMRAALLNDRIASPNRFLTNGAGRSHVEADHLYGILCRSHAERAIAAQSVLPPRIPAVCVSLSRPFQSSFRHQSPSFMVSPQAPSSARSCLRTAHRRSAQTVAETAAASGTRTYQRSSRRLTITPRPWSGLRVDVAHLPFHGQWFRCRIVALCPAVA